MVPFELNDGNEKKGSTEVKITKGKEMSVEKEFERNSEGQESELISEYEIKRYTLNQFIDKYSPFRKTKKHILTKPNLELPDYIKPPYLIRKKTPKKEKEVRFYGYIEQDTSQYSIL